MNWYKHYIGDFQRDTGHLSLAEEGAYRRMLDCYYATEKPLPLDTGELLRITRAVDARERAAVERILRDFWVRTDAGWTNPRADREIVKANTQRDINREIGKRGGRPKGSKKKTEPGTEQETEPKTESVSGMKPNGNPNQTPDCSVIPNGITGDLPAAAPPDPPDPPADPIKAFFDAGLALLKADSRSDTAKRQMLGKLRKARGDTDAMQVLLAARNKSDPWGYIAASSQPQTPRLVL